MLRKVGLQHLRRQSQILGPRYLHSHSSDHVISSDEHGVRRITLNNPKQRNILTWDVLLHLQQSLENGMSRKNLPIHCVIIEAKGNVFSAGHDLKELTTEAKEKHLKLFTLCSEVIMTIRKLPVPVIAKVNGHAAAAGCQLAAACDIVVAAESAMFSTPGINVGLFCSTPGVALVRAVPQKVAAYMLYTGLPITAKEAAQYGLVSRLVPDEKLEEETMEIAKSISAKSKPIQALGKKFFNEQMTLSESEAYRFGSQVMTENLTYKDTQDGIKAFSKKQSIKWSHEDTKVH